MLISKTRSKTTWSNIFFQIHSYYHYFFLSFSSYYVQRLLWTNDVAIMDNETSLLRFTLVKQNWINCICLYLGITYLSDISTINGESLIEGINDGDEENMQCRNLLTRPVQPKPNTMSWTLCDVHLKSYTTMNRLNFKVHLGTWTSNNSTNGRLNAYQNQNFVCSWVDDDNNWNKYSVYGDCLI